MKAKLASLCDSDRLGEGAKTVCRNNILTNYKLLRKFVETLFSCHLDCGDWVEGSGTRSWRAVEVDSPYCLLFEPFLTSSQSLHEVGRSGWILCGWPQALHGKSPSRQTRSRGFFKRGDQAEGEGEAAEWKEAEAHQGDEGKRNGQRRTLRRTQAVWSFKIFLNRRDTVKCWLENSLDKLLNPSVNEKNCRRCSRNGSIKEVKGRNRPHSGPGRHSAVTHPPLHSPPRESHHRILSKKHQKDPFRSDFTEFGLISFDEVQLIRDRSFVSPSLSSFEGSETT